MVKEGGFPNVLSGSHQAGTQKASDKMMESQPRCSAERVNPFRDEICWCKLEISMAALWAFQCPQQSPPTVFHLTHSLPGKGFPAWVKSLFSCSPATTPSRKFSMCPAPHSLLTVIPGHMSWCSEDTEECDFSHGRPAPVAILSVTTPSLAQPDLP